jgi:hypothetical protein
MSGVIEARLNAKLVRRRAEDRLELANEMKRRDMELARQVLD